MRPVDLQIRTLLAEDAADLPPTTVDIRAILRQARRQRRRRWLVALSTSVVVFGTLLVGATGGMLTSSPRPQAPTAAPASASTPPTTPGPAHFDPLVRTLKVGWMPSDLVDGHLEVTRSRQTFTAVEAGPDGQPAADTGLVVSVLAAGEHPDFHHAVPSWTVHRAAAPVRGKPASCLATRTEPRHRCSTLRWAYRQDAYAVVSYRSTRQAMTSKRITSLVRRVAGSVSLTSGSPVTAPFRLSGYAARLTPVYTRVEPPDATRSDRRWSVAVGLSADSHTRACVRIEATPHTFDAERLAGEHVNTTVGGQPASVRPGQAGTLTVYDRRGVSLTIATDDAPVSPRRLYTDLRVSPTPNNPAHWHRPLG